MFGLKNLSKFQPSGQDKILFFFSTLLREYCFNPKDPE